MTATFPGSSSVHHDPEHGRFMIPANPESAVLEYELSDGVMSIDRTFVPETLRGGGVAGALVGAAFAWAEAEGLKVFPACTYVEVYFKRHPEWTKLRAPR